MAEKTNNPRNHPAQLANPDEMKSIYTYYEPITTLPEEESLVALWKDAWSAAGFTPVVLNEDHAQRHPAYEDMLTHIRRHLPSVNPYGYDTACYLRWLAMAVVGGGLMSDADVMPYDVTALTPPKAGRITTYAEGNICPCLVDGDVFAYESAIDIFLSHFGPTETINGRPHTSDQCILQAYPAETDQVPLVWEHGKPGWESAAFVHYCNGVMVGKQPRYKWIPKLRDLKLTTGNNQ